MLGNIFTSPMTTLAGLWAVVAPGLVTQVVAYLGAQPGLGWQIVSMLIGLIVPALMPDVRKALTNGTQVQLPRS